MNSYEFSMEKVLRWRQDLEKANMENLALIQNELKQQKEILKALILEEERLKANGHKYKDIYQLKHQQLYRQKIEEKIKEQDKIINKTNEKLEDARQELIEAQKNRKIMEKLKEKDMIAYKKNMDYIQQKELDEIAILKYQDQNLL